MEKYKSLRILFLFILITTTNACTPRKGNVTETPVPGNAIVVTVTDYRELDGCEFLLVTEDGKKLQPLNLPDNMKVNGIQIYVTYKIVKGMGICMAGEMIELTFTKEKK